MRNINTQKIIDGIVKALKAEFGEGYTYYVDDILQGFKEPSFYIKLLDSKCNLVCGNRYLRKNLCVIRYFPQSELSPKKELNDVLDRLFSILEYIYVDDNLIRGTNMEVNIENNILHLSINYDFFVLKPIKNEILMQQLIQNPKLK